MPRHAICKEYQFMIEIPLVEALTQAKRQGKGIFDLINDLPEGLLGFPRVQQHVHEAPKYP